MTGTDLYSNIERRRQRELFWREREWQFRVWYLQEKRSLREIAAIWGFCRETVRKGRILLGIPSNGSRCFGKRNGCYGRTGQKNPSYIHGRRMNPVAEEPERKGSF